MTTARRAGATTAATLCGLALTVGLGNLAAPEWTEEAGLDLWDVPSLHQEIETGAQKSSKITEEIEESKQRQALKEHLIDRLISGQSTLDEVTSEFLTLNAHRSICQSMIRSSFAGATDREKTMNNVLSFAFRREQGSFIDRLLVVGKLAQQLEHSQSVKSSRWH